MEIDAIAAEHAKRLAAADALLPKPLPWDAESGTRLTTRDGIALATRSRVEPGTPEALWRPLTEYRLDVRLGGTDPGAAFGSLLTEWDLLLEETGSTDWDSAAVVTRPSRDTVGTGELLRRGFAPTRVLAVRPADRHASGPPAVPGVRIRHAEPSELATLVRLQLELRQYDAQFGLVTRRDGEERAITAATSAMLADAGAVVPSLWIAELYGKPLGFVHVELPPAADWIGGYVAVERAGYLASMHVAEEARSTGVGSALAAHVHQLFDEAGMEAVLLHHALASPRSTPFWYAQGYRPLWTSWYRRPAARG
ncbi:GNAT family N-acetyltransferase [Prauserella sp. PE36]|uniref:GNAT family N-acetyltransferase n=1 Tax=Prauserella endophytica TaxID=1592324 RepID=A0ABY2S0S8_9PSEU|nr:MULTISPECIES: GNAT family N-acetyltransferase [Prauserella]PXY17121.1 acetyltransferase [Prauserella coralliicola]RBM22781.1 GNAT family N-acetyltransferase [Prauserella sp. PE36]TKG67697.1 GNAT family N-acetyltransferase [Prauserella endophytica]